MFIKRQRQSNDGGWSRKYFFLFHIHSGCVATVFFLFIPIHSWILIHHFVFFVFIRFHYFDWIIQFFFHSSWWAIEHQMTKKWQWHCMIFLFVCLFDKLPCYQYMPFGIMNYCCIQCVCVWTFIFCWKWFFIFAILYYGTHVRINRAH